MDVHSVLIEDKADKSYKKNWEAEVLFRSHQFRATIRFPVQISNLKFAHHHKALGVLLRFVWTSAFCVLRKRLSTNSNFRTVYFWGSISNLIHKQRLHLVLIKIRFFFTNVLFFNMSLLFVLKILFSCAISAKHLSKGQEHLDQGCPCGRNCFDFYACLTFYLL